MTISNNQKHNVRSIMMMMMLTITVGLLALNPSMLAQEIGAQETIPTLRITQNIDCERESISKNVEEACYQLQVFPPLLEIQILSESNIDPNPNPVIGSGPTDVTLGVGHYTINNEAEIGFEGLLDEIEERYPTIIATGPIDHYEGDCTRQQDFAATGFIQEGQHQNCHITYIIDIREIN
jgi:hypothetical protein